LIKFCALQIHFALKCEIFVGFTMNCQMALHLCRQSNLVRRWKL